MSDSNSPLPAILGGNSAVTLDQTEANRWPILTADDENAVIQILRDGDISTHPVIRKIGTRLPRLFRLALCACALQRYLCADGRILGHWSQAGR